MTANGIRASPLDASKLESLNEFLSKDGTMGDYVFGSDDDE